MARIGRSDATCDGSGQLGIIQQVKPMRDPNRVAAKIVVMPGAENKRMQWFERHIQNALPWQLQASTGDLTAEPCK